MVHRNWECEVNETLAEEARREASILHNPRLARLYIERGVGVALIVVLTYGATGMKRLDPGYRNLFFAGSIFAAMIAITLVSIGLIALASQCRRRPTTTPNENDPPPIGW
jgi:hypothetical protein